MNVAIIYLNTSGRIGMGVAYISAMLKKYDHNVILLDSYDLTDEIIFNKIEDLNPDIVLFSVHSLAYYHALVLSKKIKEMLDVPIMFGGIHPTLHPMEVIKEESIDMVCVGEGEYAVLDVVNNLNRRDVENIWYKENGTIIKNPVRALGDLDDLPFPDRDIFDARRVVDNNGRTYFASSRGCPYTCTYCCNKAVIDLYKKTGSNYVRFRSVQNCIEELKVIKEKYNPKEIGFVDEMFLTKRQRVIEFCEVYKKEIGIPFGFMARPEHVYKDEELINTLKEAGCSYIHMGVESGDEEIRKSVNRNMTDQVIIDAFNMCRKYDIKTASFNIIGFPFETYESIQKTCDLNMKLKPDIFQCTILYPFKGTEIYKVYEKNGMLLNKQMNESYYGDTIVNLPNIPPKKLIQMENYLHLSFNRSKLLGQIALVTPPEWLNVARKVFNILTRR